MAKKSKAKLPIGELRAFRSNVAKLKRAGLLNKSVDARKAQPTKALKTAVAKFVPVIENKEKTFKVTKAQAADLKAQGYTVKNNRVVLANTLKFNKRINQVQSATELKGAYFTAKKGTIDEAVHDAFEKAKGKSVAFSVYGANSYKAFSTPEALIRDLTVYHDVRVDENDKPDRNGKYLRGVQFFIPSGDNEQYRIVRSKQFREQKDAADERRKVKLREKRAAQREAERQRARNAANQRAARARARKK
jgi:hypothetical protein